MKYQKFFKYPFKRDENSFDFYVNPTNSKAHDGILKSNKSNLILSGPKKSGKSLLGRIWQLNNNAIKFNNNFKYVINNYKNIIIDDIDSFSNEEEFFHILNHCSLNNIKLLLISINSINEMNFRFDDISSRIKLFHEFKIERPDDDMLTKLLTKLFIEKQFIINSNDIFQFIINRANRSYEEIFNIVNKLDTLTLEKKRQLTIPLIKEIL